MKLCIVHGGQTGVDRGAAQAAIDINAQAAGWVPSNMLDEYGPIPAWAMRGLKPLKDGGLMSRTIGNVVLSDLVLCIVEDRNAPYATPGTRLTLHSAQRIGRPRLCVDLNTPLAVMESWLRENAPAASDAKLMVAGPRRSMWYDGERVARSVVRALADRVWSRGDR